jgi:hypothetical protein
MRPGGPAEAGGAAAEGPLGATAEGPSGVELAGRQIGTPQAVLEAVLHFFCVRTGCDETLRQAQYVEYLYLNTQTSTPKSNASF